MDFSGNNDEGGLGCWCHLVAVEAVEVSMVGSVRGTAAVVASKAVEGSAEVTMWGTVASPAGGTEGGAEGKKIHPIIFFVLMKKSLDSYQKYWILN